MSDGAKTPTGDAVTAANGAPLTTPEPLQRRTAIDYDLTPHHDHWVVKAIQAATPGLTFLTTRFQREWLRTDIVAGLAVAAYMVPQVIAYTSIVNVPPVVGLWTALIGILAYAVMGGSRLLSIGPESTIALMAGVAIAPMAGGDVAKTVELAAALSIVVGGWCLVGRMFRLGVTADLLSQPLLIGYLAAAAVLMVAGQLGGMTKTPVHGESIIDQIVSFAQVWPQTHLATIGVAAATLALIFAIHWLAPKWPAPLIAVTVASVATGVFRLKDYGIAVVGTVPTGLVTPRLPNVSMAELTTLAVAGLGVALMSYSDNMLNSRAFPPPLLPGERPSDREVDPQKEMVALGGVSIAVGMFGGFPVSSSMSRTALAQSSRAHTQLYSLVAAVVLVLMLVVAGPIMEFLPKPALAAVVVYAATKLVKLGEFRRLAKFRSRELLLALVTLVGTVVYGILAGVLIAITLSLLEMGQRLARPRDAVLGRVPGLAGMHDVSDYKAAQTLPGLVIYRYEAPLFFANVGDLRRRVQRVVDIETKAYPDTPPRWFLLNAEANTQVDITATDGLRELTGDLALQGIKLGIVRIKHDLYDELKRAGVIDLIGEDMLFPTLPVAEEAYLDWAEAHPYEAPVAASTEEAPEATPFGRLNTRATPDGAASPASAEDAGDPPPHVGRGGDDQ